MNPQERAKKLLEDHQGSFMEQCTNDDFRQMEALIADVISVAVIEERERCIRIAEKWEGLDNVAAQIRAAGQT